MSHKKLQTETRAGQTDNPHRIYVEDWASDGDSTRLPAQSKPYEQMLTEVEEKWKRAAGAAIAGACSLSGAGSGGSSLSYPADVNCPAHWHRDEVPTAAYMLGVWPMGYSAWCSRGKLGKRRDNYMYGPCELCSSKSLEWEQGAECPRSETPPLTHRGLCTLCFRVCELARQQTVSRRRNLSKWRRTLKGQILVCAGTDAVKRHVFKAAHNSSPH